MSGPISFRFVVSDLSAVLAAGYTQAKVYRSVDGKDGTYNEVTGAASRVPIKPRQAAYTFVDTTGDSTYWYKLSYWDSVQERESALSAPRQGVDPALLVLPIENFKTEFLCGVKLTDIEGKPAPPVVFERHIRGALSYLETRLDVAIAPRVFEEQLDFFYRAFAANQFMQFRHRPILTLSEVKLVLPTSDVEESVTVYPEGAWKPFFEAGQLNLIPGGGTLLVGNITMHQLLLGMAPNLPNVFHVTYTAGFDPVPDDLIDAIGKRAAISFLPMAGNFVYRPGVVAEKTGIDGLMTETRTAQGTLGGAYGGMIREYKAQLEEMIPVLRRKYHGISVGVAG